MEIKHRKTEWVLEIAAFKALWGLSSLHEAEQVQLVFSFFPSIYFSAVGLEEILRLFCEGPPPCLHHKSLITLSERNEVVSWSPEGYLYFWGFISHLVNNPSYSVVRDNVKLGCLNSHNPPFPIVNWENGYPSSLSSLASMTKRWVSDISHSSLL